MYARILVPIDGSSVAERGLNEAIALAQKLGSTLHVLKRCRRVMGTHGAGA